VIVPDLPEPIVAYRHWKLDLDRLTLASTVGRPWTRGPDEWPQQGPLQAECFGCENPPGDDCDSLVGKGCGIYGFKRQQQLWGKGSDRYTYLIMDIVASARYPAMVWGEVWLWGRVWEHQHGWRAEFAQPKCLYVFRTGTVWAAAVEGCAELYGIPTRRLD
jgi:hypothetical protein